MNNQDADHVKAIVTAINIVIKSIKPRITNAMVHKYLDAAIEQVKMDYEVKTREELIEMMTNEIEDLFTDAKDEAYKSAMKEGEVDETMVDEAFANALSNATSWS